MCIPTYHIIKRFVKNPNSAMIASVALVAIALRLVQTKQVIIVNQTVTMVLAVLFAPVYIAAWAIASIKKKEFMDMWIVSAFEPEPIQWTPGDNGLEVGSLSVPFNYSNPTGRKFNLYLVKSSAPVSKGTMIFIPGGPANNSASNLSSGAATKDGFLPQWYWDNFDIILFDDRGTGLSTPTMTCSNKLLDALLELESSDPTLANASKTYAESCNLDLIAFTTIPAINQDMDTIRRALNLQKISLLGVSWGGSIGASWVSTYPQTVDRAVLIGTQFFDRKYTDYLQDSVINLQKSLDDFAAWCRNKGDECPLNSLGDPKDVIEKLAANLETSPLIREGKPSLNKRNFLTTLWMLNYVTDDDSRIALTQAIVDAINGDSTDLGGLFDYWMARSEEGVYEHAMVMTFANETIVPTESEALDLYRKMMTAAPSVASNSLDLVMPHMPSKYFKPQKVGTDLAPQVLIIAYTGDRVSPVSDSERINQAISGSVLVVVPGGDHLGGIDQTPQETDIAHSYLLGQNLPPGRIDL